MENEKQGNHQDTKTQRTEDRKGKRMREESFVPFERTDCQVLTRQAEDGRSVKGLKLRFAFLNQPYELGGIEGRAGSGFMLEDFDSAAFDKTIREQNIRILFDHDSSKVLGATRPSGGKPATARVYKDGNSMVAELLDIGTRSYEQDMLECLERGEIEGASHGFYVIRRDWLDPQEEKGLPTHYIREAQLLEVSVCTFPANRQTSVEMREEVLRESYESYKRQAESTESPDGHHSEEETRDAASSDEPDPHHDAAAPEAVALMRARARLMKLRSKER